MHLNIFLFLTFSTISAEEFDKYVLVYGKIYNTNSFSERIVALDVTDCGLKCSSLRETCTLANYYTGTSECRFYNWMDILWVYINPDVAVTMDTILLVQNGYKRKSSLMSS